MHFRLLYKIIGTLETSYDEHYVRRLTLSSSACMECDQFYKESRREE